LFSNLSDLGIAVDLLFRAIINLLDDILDLFNSATLFMLSPMALCAFFFYAWYGSKEEANLACGIKTPDCE
jgi:hypothetical protein